MMLPQDKYPTKARSSEPYFANQSIHNSTRIFGGGPSDHECESIIPMTESKKSYIPQIPPPPGVLRGFRAGSTSQLDRRSWLEVLDPKHRYAKNLRSYFEAWDLMGKPGDSFLEWLDDEDCIELESCPRSVLDKETVHYCREDERDQFALIIENGRVRRRRSNDYAETGPQGWIFVLRDGVLYANEKKTVSPRFHHSSFFAGECVEVAGLVVIEQGCVTKLFPHSGHYRPNDDDVQHLLTFIETSNIRLSSIEVDAQHTMKVARFLTRQGLRLRKKQAFPYFMRGDILHNFLKRKAWSPPLFDELRRAGAKREQRLSLSGLGQLLSEISSESSEQSNCSSYLAARHSLEPAPLGSSLDRWNGFLNRSRSSSPDETEGDDERTVCPVYRPTSSDNLLPSNDDDDLQFHSDHF